MFTFWKRCRHVLYFSGQVLFSSFVVVVPVAVGRGRRARGCRTGIIAGFAQCVFQDFTNCRFLMVFFAVRRWLEAMLPRLRSGSNVGMFSQAMLACFRKFRVGPTWEEALCMFDKNVLEAMMACLRMFC